MGGVLEVGGWRTGRGGGFVIFRLVARNLDGWEFYRVCQSSWALDRDVVVQSVRSISTAADFDGGFDSILYHRMASIDSDTIDLLFHKGVVAKSRK